MHSPCDHADNDGTRRDELEDTITTSTFDDLIVTDLNCGYADAMQLLGRADVSDVWSEISTWPADRLRLTLMAAVSGLDEMAASTPCP